MNTIIIGVDYDRLLVVYSQNGNQGLVDIWKEHIDAINKKGY